MDQDGSAVARASQCLWAMAARLTWAESLGRKPALQWTLVLERALQLAHLSVQASKSPQPPRTRESPRHRPFRNMLRSEPRNQRTRRADQQAAALPPCEYGPCCEPCR